MTAAAGCAAGGRWEAACAGVARAFRAAYAPAPWRAFRRSLGYGRAPVATVEDGKGAVLASACTASWETAFEACCLDLVSLRSAPFGLSGCRSLEEIELRLAVAEPLVAAALAEEEARP